MIQPVQLQSTNVKIVRLHATAETDALGSHEPDAPDTLGSIELLKARRFPAIFPRPIYLPPALSSLEWVNQFGEIASWENKWAVLFPWNWALFLPVVATVAWWAPSFQECVQVFLAWLSLAALTLTMNHRFFAHGAFKTSRACRALFACCACMGLQYGPLWWSSKHRKHHKLCDIPGDPHSWKGTSWWYSWYGWVCAVQERSINVEYLHPSLFDAAPAFTLPACLTPAQDPPAAETAKGGKVVAPELLLIDRLWFVPSLAVYSTAILLGVCQRTAFFYFVGPSLCLPLPILLFNVMFHPPNITPTSNGCFAMDSLLDPLAVILGEAAHEDHHRFPDRAKRPSPLPFAFDMCYEAIIRPLLTLGLIWDPKEYKTAARTGDAAKPDAASIVSPKDSGVTKEGGAMRRVTRQNAGDPGTPAEEGDALKNAGSAGDHSRKSLALIGVLGM